MKILIIEDEEELSKSIVAYLKAETYSCEVANNYKTAIEKTESFDYDCILLDISLPDGNGLQILKELKANHKTDGVIIISARDSMEDRIAGLNLGADDYLPKPFHLPELSARIAAVIRRRRFDGSSILTLNELSIHTDAKAVTVSNKPVTSPGPNTTSCCTWRRIKTGWSPKMPSASAFPGMKRRFLIISILYMPI
jgi:DNA-binding response OmpR family regulator